MVVSGCGRGPHSAPSVVGGCVDLGPVRLRRVVAGGRSTGSACCQVEVHDADHVVDGNALGLLLDGGVDPSAVADQIARWLYFRFVARAGEARFHT